MPRDFDELLAQQRETAREELQAAWRMHVARVEEQLAAGWPEQIEQVVERRFQALAALLEAEWGRRAADLRGRIEREVSQSLNQVARRMRRAGSRDGALDVLLDAAAEHGSRVSLWWLEGAHLRCAGARGFPGETQERLFTLRIPAGSAPALVNALAGADTMVAVPSAGEISEDLAEVLAARHTKAYLFPVIAGPKQKGVLLVEGEDETVGVSTLELLAWMASAAVAMPASDPGVESWLELPEAEREVHGRAQRFARIRVAAMRLHRWRAVENGRQSRNLYGELKKEIDAAREEYWEQFGRCPSIVDYLHRELVSTLANHDESLLGADYPGPVV
ncbi:MAG: hypothetical protein K6T59_10110 [Bryobacteraceae bacterium]|jgi:hypothetical protein|nr:hypothetical protein [Bryobacteraceae bacterium]